MTRTSEELQRDAAAISKRGADLKAFAHELAATAAEMCHKSEGLAKALKDTLEKSKAVRGKEDSN